MQLMTFCEYVIIGFISTYLTYVILYLKKKYGKGCSDKELIKLIRLNEPYPGPPEELKEALQHVSDEDLEVIVECLVKCKADKIYQSFSDSSDRAKKIVDRALLNRG